MAAQRDSGWILVLTAVVVIATQAAAVAINAATSVQTRWPLGLEAVRAHPFQWSIAFTVLIVAAGSAAWWLQQRSGRRADELRPPVIETPEWVVKRPEEVNRVVAASRWRDGGDHHDTGRCGRVRQDNFGDDGMCGSSSVASV